MDKSPLQQAIDLCGGSQKALAERIGRTQQLVSLLARGAKISAEVAVDIEKATDGQVPRHKLRPDIFSAPEQVTP